MAKLIATQPQLRPTTAIKRTLHSPGDADIRRLQVKWKAEGPALLAAAKAKHAAKEALAQERRTAAFRERVRKDHEKISEFVSMVVGGNAFASRAVREHLESPTARATWEIYNSPSMRAAREMYNSPSMRAAREMYNSPSMRAAREMYNSPSMRAAREMYDSPSMRAAREIYDSPSARAAREIFDSPMMRALRELK
jgi:uncharacterized protein (DUF1330 family)